MLSQEAQRSPGVGRSGKAAPTRVPLAISEVVSYIDSSSGELHGARGPNSSGTFSSQCFATAHDGIWPPAGAALGQNVPRLRHYADEELAKVAARLLFDSCPDAGSD